ncbi:hypothetical protein LC087_06490 [Bacillus carboniphilus]|uniref:GerMN domain-containing protein n=1 Tax=Bacillus carboniphilus TaxID=86663 RepID=A0ABY9JZL0_9BACI|nr:hypothetical protein [Bacillus carboniphilus]WLR43773.1 hypothetical protein LC087_06490 [Bacillus carboniphilus]
MKADQEIVLKVSQDAPDSDNIIKFIEESFRWHNKQLKIVMNEKSVDLLPEMNQQRAYLKLSVERDFLVPSNKKFKNISEAFNFMKEGNQFLLPSIDPSLDLDIETSEGGRTLIVFVNNGEKVNSSQEAIFMIEAILMTAKEFNYEQVHFKGINEKQIGKWNLDQPINVPFSPNPIN